MFFTSTESKHSLVSGFENTGCGVSFGNDFEGPVHFYAADIVQIKSVAVLLKTTRFTPYKTSIEHALNALMLSLSTIFNYFAFSIISAIYMNCEIKKIASLNTTAL